MVYCHNHNLFQYHKIKIDEFLIIFLQFSAHIPAMVCLGDDLKLAYKISFSVKIFFLNSKFFIKNMSLGISLINCMSIEILVKRNLNLNYQDYFELPIGCFF